MFKAVKQFGFLSFNIINLCILFMTAPFAYATEAPKIPQISTLPGPQNTDVSQVNVYLRNEFLPNLAMTVIKFAIPLSVVFLIFGAIQFIAGMGNTEKVSLAKKTVTFSLLGLVISLLSYAIVQIIFFGGFTITQIQ